MGCSNRTVMWWVDTTKRCADPKQFGLERLQSFSTFPCLQTLHVTIVGARITCDSFQNAMKGIASIQSLFEGVYVSHTYIPSLPNEFRLDMSTCEIGIQRCGLRYRQPAVTGQGQRGLSNLRNSSGLKRLHLILLQPCDRLLSSLGAIRHIPTLRHLCLHMDFRFGELSQCHIKQLAHLANIHTVDIRVFRAHVVGWYSTFQQLAQALHEVPFVSSYVCIHRSDCKADGRVC